MDSASFWIDKRTSDSKYVVCLPGWAHDWQIMNWCSANVNRIYVRESLRADIIPQLADFLRESCIGPVSILGWSLGGFAAVDFARNYPELVASLVLVGIRRKYNPENIQATRDGLKSGHTEFMKDFYRRCFLPAQRRDWTVFRTELLDSYLDKMKIDELIEGLDYLAESYIDEQSLSICPTLIVHGEKDVVSPLDEVSLLAESAGTPLHIIEDASHAAFLHPNFSGIFEQWLK